MARARVLLALLALIVAAQCFATGETAPCISVLMIMRVACARLSIAPSLTSQMLHLNQPASSCMRVVRRG